MKKSEPAILVRSLDKKFGDTHALKGLDFEAPAGSILGVLGPNGAGKTTAVRILATLLEPDSGEAKIAGLDVVENAAEVRSQIGLIGQSAAVDELLTGRENLTLFGRLHGLDRKQALARANDLLEHFDLTDAGDRIAKTYSGGMRRRLDIAAGMVVTPKVLFLDEPTTGLDPVSRNAVWEIVRELSKSGTTILLTTQYLEEADQLADDIVVIDHGKAIARGTSDHLKSLVGGERVELEIENRTQLSELAKVVESVTGSEPAVDDENGIVTASFVDGARRLPELVRALDSANIELAGLALRKPTLDDVFLHLTGRTTETEEIV